MRGKHSFTREFKLSVLRELESGKSVAEVCRQHDLKKEVVCRWRREYRKNPKFAFAGRGNPSKLETKNAELERTVGQLYMEIAFLKKVSRRLQDALAEMRNQK